MRIPEDLPVIDFDDITSRGYRSSADDGPNVLPGVGASRVQGAPIAPRKRG